MSRLVLLILLLLAPTAVAEPLRFQVIYGEIPNLVYQLDCVSEAIGSCSREAHRAFWEKEILRDEADRAALQRWKAVATKYGASVSLPVDVPLPLINRGHELELPARRRVAGMLARSVDDFVDRIGVVVMPADRAILGEVLRHFQPRFRVVWEKQAPAGRVFAAELEQLLGRPDLLALVEAMRIFYGAEVPGDRPLPFVVLDRPLLGSKKGTNAEQVDGVSLFEFLPGEKATQRLDVVIHELCHFFYFSARPARVSQMQVRFASSRVPGAIGGFRLFDEAVATAFGNGMVQRLADPPGFERGLARPNGFYNDADIDRAAKALLPFLDTWLATGKSIADPTFVDAYLGVLTKAYGAGLVAPRLGLFAVVLFVDDSLPDATAKLDEVALLNYLSAMTGKVDDPKIGPWLESGQGTGIFVVPPKSVAGLVGLGLLTRAEATRLSRHKGPVMLGKPWRRGESLYVIVATEKAPIDAAFTRLAAAPAPLHGVTALD